eukprot:Gb_11998 [translate_table: standard]
MHPYTDLLSPQTLIMRWALCFPRRVRLHSPPSARFYWRSCVKSLSTETCSIVVEKPQICTADELHYVAVPGTDWRLALWRYNPSPQAPARNHPLLLLSGVGTNAIGFDLAPGDVHQSDAQHDVSIDKVVIHLCHLQI